MNESFAQQAAHSAGVADRLAAGGAELRQRHVDDEAEGRAQRAGDAAQPRRRACPCVASLRLHARNASAPAASQCVIPALGSE